jgi:hypothetical protein
LVLPQGNPERILGTAGYVPSSVTTPSYDDGLTFDLILRLGAADDIRIFDYGKASFEN